MFIDETLQNAQILFVLIYLSTCSSDSHSEQAWIEIHETNTTDTQNNDDSSNFTSVVFLIGPGVGHCPPFRLPPEAFDQLFWPHPREYAIISKKKKKMLMPRGWPGYGHRWN